MTWLAPRSKDDHKEQIKFPTVSDAEIYEMFLIKKYRPLYNTTFKRGEIPTLEVKFKQKWQTKSKKSFL